MVILQGRCCYFTIMILGWPPRRHSLCLIRRRPVSKTLWFGWRSGGCCWRRHLAAASRRYVAIDTVGSRRDWNGNLTNRNTFDIVLVVTVVRCRSNRSVATFRWLLRHRGCRNHVSLAQLSRARLLGMDVARNDSRWWRKGGGGARRNVCRCSR